MADSFNAQRRRAVSEPGLVKWGLLAVALVYLGLFLVLPLASVYAQALADGFGHFFAAILDPDALVDLPFALPTAVAGIALTALYAPNGWIGSWLEPMGIKVAFTRLGIMVALTFIGLPFVVRTLEPVLQDLDPEFEEAAATLGAGRLQTFLRVVFPAILPALLTGVALAFARGVGEYGSVIFIAGNMPMISEIAPLLIVVKLEQYDYAGAAAVGVAMLLISFLLLLLINLLQRWKTAQGSI